MGPPAVIFGGVGVAAHSGAQPILAPRKAAMVFSGLRRHELPVTRE